MNVPLPLLTNSRLKAARACLRLHKLRYIDGYAPARAAEDLRFGTLVHKGLEAWWRAAAGERLTSALRAVREAGEADPFELAKAEVLLCGYDARWGTQDYEVLGVEVEFAGPLRNPVTGAVSRVWMRGGKLDALVRDATGRVLLVEHKTSSEDVGPGSDYWRRLRMDSQVSTYFEGARILGHEVSGCIYDVLGKPGQKPLKATPVEARKYTKATKTEPSRLYAGQRDRDETPLEYQARIADALSAEPDRYFQRGEVVRLDGELHDALADDWLFAQRLREDVRLGRAPRNPDACIRYGKTCEFFEVCTGAASLDDPSRFTRSDNVHPELAGPASAPQPKEEAA